MPRAKRSNDDGTIDPYGGPDEDDDAPLSDAELEAEIGRLLDAGVDVEALIEETERAEAESDRAAQSVWAIEGRLAQAKPVV